MVMTITDRHHAYARKVIDTLKNEGVRLEDDLRNEKIGFKIREAVAQRVPYMIIVGDKEIESGTIALRKRGEQSTATMSVEGFLSRFHEEVSSRT
jgi:threonyl-tRNA synthetase